MDLCEVYGKLVDAQNSPLAGISIYATCVDRVKDNLDINNPDIIGIGTYPLAVISDPSGSFTIELIKKKQYRIVIRPIGYDQVVSIPEDDEVNLWTLSPVTSTNTQVIEPTPSDSPVIEDPQW